MKVVIAGSGLVGAATALALRRLGIECALYDQVNLGDAIMRANGGPVAVEFGDSGGSVLLNASALRVLKFLDVLEDVKANSLAAPSAIFCKIDGSAPITGDMIYFAKRSGENDPALQCPLQILRSKLHDILVRAAYAAGARTFVGKKLVGVVESESIVTTKFADGTTATGDLLIGADSQAEFTGVIGYIGVVNLAEHDIQLKENCAFYIDRDQRHMVWTFKVSDQVAAVQVSTFDDPDPEESQDEAYRPYTDLPKHSERLSDMIDTWGVPPHVVQMMHKAHRISPASIYDLPDLETYNKGRVLLIGDAAHGMVPNIGLGLGTGLEDVGTLMELLNQLPNESDLPRVLELYSRLRVPHATKKAQRSRERAAGHYGQSVFGSGLSHFLVRVANLAFHYNLVKPVEFFDCPAQAMRAIAEGSE
ncbi:hypothetical protein HDU98_000050 [Podochytrium sp. JEL0797]|nr:hypothetical protein HDU98_000050 [Podochytrium sp. JEL0797]